MPIKLKTNKDFIDGYDKGRADAVDEELYEYAFWLFTNYSGGGAVGGSVAHDNAVKSIEEFKQWQKEAEK